MGKCRIVMLLVVSVFSPTLCWPSKKSPCSTMRGVAPAVFGAAEIRRAVEARGDTCVEKRLDEASKTKADLRIVLATTPEESQRLAKALGMKPPKHNGPQCYAIRTKADAAGTTIAVLGADAAGAMYGGLDVAEAIRLANWSRISTTPTAPRTSPAGGSSSTSRWTPARPAIPTPATPRSRTSPRCGAWTSGGSSSTRWPASGSTC